jgi:hypothetical protein
MFTCAYRIHVSAEAGTVLNPFRSLPYIRMYGKVSRPFFLFRIPISWPRFASSWRFSYTEVAEGFSWAGPRWRGGKQGRACLYRCLFSFLNSRTSNSASSSHQAVSNRRPDPRLQNARRLTICILEAYSMPRLARSAYKIFAMCRYQKGYLLRSMLLIELGGPEKPMGWTSMKSLSGPAH